MTGESLGQVASQTLENLAVIGAATDLLVLRPLIGLDKNEIAAEAVRIGTYETSIEPDQDCCTLFTPRNPATRARFDEADAAESGLPLTELIDACLRAVEVEDFAFPAIGPMVGSGR